MFCIFFFMSLLFSFLNIYFLYIYGSNVCTFLLFKTCLFVVIVACVFAGLCKLMDACMFVVACVFVGVCAHTCVFVSASVYLGVCVHVNRVCLEVGFFRFLLHLLSGPTLMHS